MSLRTTIGLLVGIVALSLTATPALAGGFFFGFNLGLGSSYWFDWAVTPTYVYDSYPVAYSHCSPRTVVYYRSSPRRYYDRGRGVRVYRNYTSCDRTAVYRRTSPRYHYRDVSRRTVVYRDRTPRYRSARTHYTTRSYRRTCRPIVEYRRGSSLRGGPRIHSGSRHRYRTRGGSYQQRPRGSIRINFRR